MFMPPLSHRAIYIIKRRSTSKEITIGRQYRSRSRHTDLIGEDLTEYKHVIFIDQANCHSLFYLAHNLHSNHHGSIDISELPHVSPCLDFMNISNHVISEHSSGRSRVHRHDDVVVAYDRSPFLNTLNKTMTSAGGLDMFHHDLTTHLLNGGVLDKVRMNGKIDPTQEAYNIRARFGYGRGQEKSNRNTWWYKSQKMPTCDLDQFWDMPMELRSRLMILFEASTQFVRREDPNAYNNDKRNRIFSSRMNRLMGFPGSKSMFEYIDIVLSCNTILRKHIDEKNDHRDGYNHCAVYSFFFILHGLEFKVSIVMTMRTTVGAACENIV